MQFFNILKALAFVAAVNAVQFTNTNYQISAGSPFTITWSGNVAPVTIFLKSGESTNLQTVNTIVSGATGNSFTWLPSASLTNQMYALAIEDDGNTNLNYSPQFMFTGGVAPLPTTVPTTSTTTGTSTTLTSETATTTATGSTTAAPLTTTTAASLSATPSTTVAGITMPNNMTMSGSNTATGTAATGKATGSTTLKSSTTGTSASASASKSANGTSGAGRLANPIALILFVGGALAFFN